MLFAEAEQKGYFNSTMVRLKERHVYPYCLIASFQFHYGTIKRSNKGAKAIEDCLFQFHYGTIKSCSSTIIRTYGIISIPLWYD